MRSVISLPPPLEKRLLTGDGCTACTCTPGGVRAGVRVRVRAGARVRVRAGVRVGVRVRVRVRSP